MQGMTHDYWAAWKQFVLHGVMQEDVLPPALMQSWRRCAALGLGPYSDRGLDDDSRVESAGVSNGSGSPMISGVSHELLSLVRPALEDLHQFIEG